MLMDRWYYYLMNFKSHYLIKALWKNFERAVQDATVNKQLDVKIAKFLVLATPYFLLNACHKALEWLKFRYYIHHYNREQFILLILPFHETRIFVRALKLVDWSDDNDKWHCMAPMQKRDVTLPSGILIKHMISDKELLKTLCTHVTFATYPSNLFRSGILPD